MEPLPPPQGHSTPIDGWGYKSNKHLYDFINDHANLWDARENVMREMDPKMKNTSVEQNKYKRDIEFATDFYDRMVETRAKIAATHDTGWKEDVERDEGGKFTTLNKS